MKKILAIYYTQSGQLKNILDSTLKPLLNSDNINIDYLKIEPTKDYPFPWGKEFYDCFPETVMGIPCKLEPYILDSKTTYDLVIFAYQPWFMSPSIPAWSFLESNQAQEFLNGKNVITLVGARNMWAGAQEIIKQKLQNLNANLIGNIVLQDRADNVIAGFTIIKWLMYGNKGPSLLLPEAGVSNKDIDNSVKFGDIILNCLQKEELKNLQPKLIEARAVQVKYHLLKIELNGRKIFCKFANLAIKQEIRGVKFRKRTLVYFKTYLLFALFIISPFVSFLFMVIRILLFPIANKSIDYYKGVKLK